MFNHSMKKESCQLLTYNKYVDEHKEQANIDFILSDYTHYKITVWPQHLETSFK